MIHTIKRYSLLLALLVFAVSCGEKDFTEYTNADSTQNIVDPYLQVLTSVVPFQAGVESYDIAFNVLNGDKRLSKIDLYKQFTDAVSGGQSETVLFRSYDSLEDLKTEIADGFNYDDLREGLSVGGTDLPADETELAIGSGWVLSFVGTFADGSGTVDLPGAINVGVLSPYAGLYEVIESDYYRINVQSGIADWTGQERFIGSVDATTFSYNDFWGPFGWTGASFNFSIDEETNVITVPILVDGALFSGNRALGCDTEPEQFVDVPCEGSNILVKDPDNPNAANGLHEIVITYGYFTDGSGSRQFYERLRKK